MSHTASSHCRAVNELCRTCGSRNIRIKELARRKRPIPCSKISDSLLKVFEVDISNDAEGVHPDYVCHGCDNIIRRVNARTNGPDLLKRARDQRKEMDKIWCPFKDGMSIEDCTVCSHRISLKYGCVKRKAKTVEVVAKTTNSSELEKLVVPKLEPLCPSSEPDSLRPIHQQETLLPVELNTLIPELEKTCPIPETRSFASRFNEPRKVGLNPEAMCLNEQGELTPKSEPPVVEIADNNMDQETDKLKEADLDTAKPSTLVNSLLSAPTSHRQHDFPTECPSIPYSYTSSLQATTHPRTDADTRSLRLGTHTPNTNSASHDIAALYKMVFNIPVPEKNNTIPANANNVVDYSTTQWTNHCSSTAVTPFRSSIQNAFDRSHGSVLYDCLDCRQKTHSRTPVAQQARAPQCAPAVRLDQVPRYVPVAPAPTMHAFVPRYAPLARDQGPQYAPVAQKPVALHAPEAPSPAAQTPTAQYTSVVHELAATSKIPVVIEERSPGITDISAPSTDSNSNAATTPWTSQYNGFSATANNNSCSQNYAINAGHDSNSSSSNSNNPLDSRQSQVVQAHSPLATLPQQNIEEIPQVTMTDSSTSPMISHCETLWHSLEQPLTAPLTDIEQKVLTHLIKRKLHNQPQKKILVCKTGGQPLVFFRIVKQRQKSAITSSGTKNYRKRLIKSILDVLEGAYDTQMSSELDVQREGSSSDAQDAHMLPGPCDEGQTEEMTIDPPISSVEACVEGPWKQTTQDVQMSSESLSGVEEPSNELTQDVIQMSSESLSGVEEPSNELTQDKIPMSSESLSGVEEPSNEFTQDEIPMSSESLSGVEEPSNELTQDVIQMSSESLSGVEEPSNELTQDEIPMSSESLSGVEEPSNELTQDVIQMSSESLSGVEKPSDETAQDDINNIQISLEPDVQGKSDETTEDALISSESDNKTLKKELFPKKKYWI